MSVINATVKFQSANTAIDSTLGITLERVLDDLNISEQQIQNNQTCEMSEVLDKIGHSYGFI